MENDAEEILRLANYTYGYGVAMKDKELTSAAHWLRQLSENICAGGIIGCGGGKDCTSDHK